MKRRSVIKINFRGGIISPGDLFQVLMAAGKVHIAKVSFGTRQQLLVDVHNICCDLFTSLLDELQIKYEKDTDERPNVVSSGSVSACSIAAIQLSTATSIPEASFVAIASTKSRDVIAAVAIFVPRLSSELPNYWFC